MSILGYFDSLPPNIKSLAKVPNRELLQKLYIAQHLSTRKCGEILGFSHKHIQKYLRIFNIPIRGKSEAQKGRKFNKKHREKLSKAKKGKPLSEEHKKKLRGRKPWNYKGGFIEKSGYKIITKGGIRNREHRLIIEKILKRKLKPNEIVHHKNGNRSDNRLENLAIMTSKEHIKLHDPLFKRWGKQTW